MVRATTTITTTTAITSSTTFPIQTFPTVPTQLPPNGSIAATTTTTTTSIKPFLISSNRKSPLGIKPLLISANRKSTTSSQFDLLSLPSELILAVLKWLEPKELCRISCVCHRLRILACDGLIWRRFLPSFIIKQPSLISSENKDLFQLYSNFLLNNRVKLSLITPTFIDPSSAITAWSLDVSGSKIVVGSEKSIWIHCQESKQTNVIHSAHEAAVVAIHILGQTIASGSNDLTIKLWDLNTSKQISLIRNAHDIAIRALKLVGSDLLVSGGGDCLVKIWNRKSSSFIRAAIGHTDVIRGIEVVDDGKTIISCSHDGTVRCWDLESVVCKKVWKAPGSPKLYCLAANSEIVVAGGDTRVDVWNRITGQHLFQLGEEQRLSYVMSVQLKGAAVVTAAYSGLIQIWNLLTKQLVHKLRHTHYNAFNVIVTDSQIVGSSPIGGINIWAPEFPQI